MSKAISVRLMRTTSTGQAGGQRNHDLRVGRQPGYVNREHSHRNRVLLEPLPPGALRRRAEERRAVTTPKRAMRSNASIAERAIITFGKDAQQAIREDPERADRLYREVAQAIGREFGIELTGLVVHEDEASPHAHAWFDSFDGKGIAVSRPISQSGSRIQDIAAAAAQRVVPEIERGKRKSERIADGEDPAKLARRTVKDFHADLTGKANPSGPEVATALQQLREAEQAEKEAIQRAEEAEARREAAETATAEIEARWRPKLGGLLGPDRNDLAQRDSAFEASLREIEAGTCAPAEPEGEWDIHDKQRWDEVGPALHPGPLGWGSRIWASLRKVAAVLGGEVLNNVRAERDEAQTAAGRVPGLEETIRTTSIRRDRRDAAAARALAAIAEGRTAPGKAEGQWSMKMDPGWWASENHGLHPGPLGWGRTLWDALHKAGQALLTARNERDKALEELAAAMPAAEAEELRGTSAHRLLILGASSGNQEMIARAIEEGAPLDKRLDHGRGMTALHAALNWTKPAAVEQLLEAGADPDARDANGQTPAEFARGLCGTASPARRKLLEETLRVLEPKQPSYDHDSPSPGM